MKFSQADAHLSSLDYKDYDLMDLVNIGKSVDNFKSSTLAKIELPFPYDSHNCLVRLSDLKVCLKYQRKMRLKKVVKKLTTAGGFNKEAAGHIDVAVRPDGTMYIWDGFRRAFMAGLAGLEFVPASIYYHPENRTIPECEKYEAKMFKIRNADTEKMKPEEIFRSKIIYGDKEAEQFLQFLKDCKLDVEKLNPGHKELSGMVMIHEKWANESISHDNLIKASHLIQKTWSQDPTVSGYLMAGVGEYLEANDDIDGSFDDEEINDKFRQFVLVKPPRPQSDLTNSRLNSAQSQSIAYYIGFRVMEMEVDHLKELAKHLDLNADNIALILSKQSK